MITLSGTPDSCEAIATYPDGRTENWEVSISQGEIFEMRDADNNPVKCDESILSERGLHSITIYSQFVIE